MQGHFSKFLRFFRGKTKGCRIRLPHLRGIMSALQTVLRRAGRPVLGVQRPPTFLARLGRPPAFGEKPHYLITASASARCAADPIPPGARRHFARQPSPCSSDRGLQTPQVSGLCSLRSVHAACDTQSFARRLATGPAVIHSARGAFAKLGIVLVCGPFTTSNQR